jgi:hypothetical protein
LAGVDFLALATALLGSTDNFGIALALETMIEKTLPIKTTSSRRPRCTN